MSDHKLVAIIDYTNHRGERAKRRIEPIKIVFTPSKWHPEPQWILEAFDWDKKEMRLFAMSGIHSWEAAK